MTGCEGDGVPRPKAHRRRHSRKALLWLALLAVLTQLGGGLLLDHVWPQVRFPDAAAARRQLRQAAPPPTIVSLGSSRFQVGILHLVVNPLLREATGKPVYLFNAAVPAGDAIVYEMLLDDVLRVKPRLLLLEVSPETLARYSTFLTMHLLRQTLWRDVPAFAPELMRGGGWWRLAQGRLLPLWLHRLEMQRRLAPLRRRDEIRLGRLPYPGVDGPAPGLVPLVEQPGARAIALMGRACLRSKLRDYRIGGVVSRSLERILERCREQGVEVLLIGVPAPGLCREGHSPAVMEAYRAYLAELRSKFGCDFVDFRARVPDNGFVDATHLSSGGAILFSRLLVQEVLLPWWRQHSGERYAQADWEARP